MKEVQKMREGERKKGADTSQEGTRLITRTCRKNQITSTSRAPVDPVLAEVRLCEEAPGRGRVDEGEVREEDAAPAALGFLDSTVAEVALPFLAHECRAARQRRGGMDGDHVDSVIVFPGAKRKRRRVGVESAMVFLRDDWGMLERERDRMSGWVG